MCVVSMVMDHFKPLIPDPNRGDWWYPNGTLPTVPLTTTDLDFSKYVIISKEEIEELQSLIKNFRDAVEAAKLIDKLTNQPDCADPEKVKLEERVSQLEKKIKLLENKSRKSKIK